MFSICPMWLKFYSSEIPVMTRHVFDQNYFFNRFTLVYRNFAP